MSKKSNNLATGLIGVAFAVAGSLVNATCTLGDKVCKNSSDALTDISQAIADKATSKKKK